MTRRPPADPPPDVACGTCRVGLSFVGSPDAERQRVEFEARHSGQDHQLVRRLPKQKGDPQPGWTPESGNLPVPGAPGRPGGAQAAGRGNAPCRRSSKTSDFVVAGAKGIGVTPYYDVAGVTIYAGDCLKILPGIDPVDVVITDPPYNVGKAYASHDDAMPAEAYIGWMRAVLSTCAALASEVVFFPGTANLLSVSDMLSTTPLRHVRTLGWHKREFAGDKWNGGPAMCWEPVIWASSADRPHFNRIYGTWGRDFLVVNATHGDPFTKLHPCPKPVEVMRWLVGLFCPEGGTVLDPFAGTGATLRAAKDLGRKAVGIELEPAYCDAAITRLGQGVLAL